MGIIIMSNSTATATTTSAAPTSSIVVSPLSHENDKLYLWALIVLLPLIVVLVGLDCMECISCRKVDEENPPQQQQSPPPTTSPSSSSPSTLCTRTVVSNTSPTTIASGPGASLANDADPTHDIAQQPQKVIPTLNEQENTNASPQDQRKVSASAALGGMQGHNQDEEVDITEVKRLD